MRKVIIAAVILLIVGVVAWEFGFIPIGQDSAPFMKSDVIGDGDLEMVKAKLKANPDLLYSTAGAGLSMTPLHVAAADGFTDVVKLLLTYKVDVNAGDDSGQTPLIWAAGNGHIDIVQLLLARGANVNAKDRWGQTALHLATFGLVFPHGHKDVVELLLKKGADVNAKANNGTTPLSWAVQGGCNDIADLLRQHGGH